MTQAEAQQLVNQYLELGTRIADDDVAVSSVAVTEMEGFAHGLNALEEEDQRKFFVELYGVVEGSNATSYELDEQDMVDEMVNTFYDFYPRFDGQNCPSFDHLMRR
jgi:hypothetical protein